MNDILKTSLPRALRANCGMTSSAGAQIQRMVLTWFKNSEIHLNYISRFDSPHNFPKIAIFHDKM